MKLKLRLCESEENLKFTNTICFGANFTCVCIEMNIFYRSLRLRLSEARGQAQGLSWMHNVFIL